MRQIPNVPAGMHIRFNPRICKRCDRGYDVRRSDNTVSIHASVKDATCYNGKNWEYVPVSIHASVKDATVGYTALNMVKQVSIHASVKDATIDRSSLEYNVEVSIHASVKDATGCHTCGDQGRTVSIHASVKDATGRSGNTTCERCFNPRICKRCDFFSK